MRRCVALLALILVTATPGALLAQEEEAAPALPDSAFPQSPLSPGGAFIRSLVIPGWAQAELGAEARGAFYFFAEAFSIFMVARSQIRLSHAERTLPEGHEVISSRRQQKEDWIALAVFWAFFAGADGWVSVQLYGFDERTGLQPDEVALLVGWKIPFGP
ncbi:MAG: hypothetical protein JSV86_05125 [Gemmatimonadota bacterium]|nr:MAG: hypothetical protein JSV86_05125 [Gemmatimonadota bacterium]